MNLYFVRHGQTEMNLNKLVQGRIDEPLNLTGKLQAAAAERVLKEKEISFIFSSPLSRALQTAEIINRSLKLKKIVVDDRLTELDIGSMAGKNLQSKSMKEKKAFYKHPEVFGGETAANFAGRIKSFYNDLKIYYPQSSVLIVAHSGIYVELSKILYHKKTEIPNNGEIVNFPKKSKNLYIIKPVLSNSLRAEILQEFE